MCTIFTRGKHPSISDCRMIEKVPEMIACKVSPDMSSLDTAMLTAIKVQEMAACRICVGDDQPLQLWNQCCTYAHRSAFCALRVVPKGVWNLLSAR